MHFQAAAGPPGIPKGLQATATNHAQSIFLANMNRQKQAFAFWQATEIGQPWANCFPTTVCLPHFLQARSKVSNLTAEKASLEQEKNEISAKYQQRTRWVCQGEERSAEDRSRSPVRGSCTHLWAVFGVEI
jgi:hypothetical protein